jgi:hypothetical protein
MGDSAAVLILRILYPLGVLTDLQLNATKTILRMAFAWGHNIKNPSDKVPAVTMCLLAMLRASETDPVRRASVESTIEVIESHVRAVEGRPDGRNPWLSSPR